MKGWETMRAKANPGEKCGAAPGLVAAPVAASAVSGGGSLKVGYGLKIAGAYVLMINSRRGTARGRQKDNISLRAVMRRF